MTDAVRPEPARREAEVLAVELREPELRAQVRDVLGKLSNAEVIAFRAAPRWGGAGTIEVDGRAFDVAACPSPLAVRDQLSREREADRGLVVLTDSEDGELGMDVLVRLAKRRVLRPDRWGATLAMFGARNLDPALTKVPWLADALLHAAPSDGYAKVPSGMLDEESAWQAFLSERLKITDRRPGLPSLLQWSLRRTSQAEFSEFDETARAGVLGWWSRSAGAPAELFARLVESSLVADAVPLGIVLNIVFDRQADDPRPQHAVAKDRLRRWLGDAPLEPARVLRFAGEAERLVRRHWSLGGLAAVRPLLDRGSAILGELGIESEAVSSDLLLTGFDQRRIRFARAIVAALDGAGTVAQVEAAEESVLAHERVRSRDADAEPMEMATRLARWLGDARTSPPPSCAEAALRYSTEGAFVDRARDALRRGSEAPLELDAAFRRLLVEVSARRSAENQRFAELLAEWSKVAESQHAAVLPIESVLGEVVAPLAVEEPVLLLVIDGMSLAVYEELVDDLDRMGFRELRRANAGRRMLALGALPTVTAVCRTSLLCGKIVSGNDETELVGFPAHPALRAAGTESTPPVLFHKRELRGASGVGLSEKVRSAIASRRRRVVGVVVNAVDDHLLKGDQVRARWSIDGIKPLGALLDAARESNRLVILTSDHGHVLQNDQEFRRSDDGGERWRIAQGAIAADETEFAGPRVVGGSSASIFAPWSEDVRYGAKRNGYHGGASLQEVVVPIGVWSPTEVDVAGWQEAAPPRPAWWYEARRVVSDAEARAPEVPPRRKKHKAKAPQQTLFDLDGDPKEEVVIGDIGEKELALGVSLVDRLFLSEVFAEQKKLGGRAAVPDDRARAILGALLGHGGKLLRPALSLQVDLPSMRVNGYLTQLRKVLNVDGYDVLSIDADSDTVSLDRDLLVTQFELGSD